MVTLILSAAFAATNEDANTKNNANATVSLRDQGVGVVAMPRIALGTGGYDNDTAHSAVSTAFAAGFTHVHTAFDYFNLPGVAAAIADDTAPARHSVFLTAMTSPCIHIAGPPVRHVADPDACEQLTLREINETLALLGQSYVDLLLLHGPSEPFGYEGGCSAEINALNVAQWKVGLCVCRSVPLSEGATSRTELRQLHTTCEIQQVALFVAPTTRPAFMRACVCVQAYTTALQSGLARAIGVSNFCPSCLEGLRDPLPAVNQLQWHVGMGPDPEGLMSYCEQHDIIVQAYAPLASGAVVANCSVCDDVARKYEYVSVLHCTHTHTPHCKRKRVVSNDCGRLLALWRSPIQF